MACDNYRLFEFGFNSGDKKLVDICLKVTGFAADLVDIAGFSQYPWMPYVSIGYRRIFRIDALE